VGPESVDLDTTIVDGIPITSVAQILDMRAAWELLARPNHPGARRLDRASREEVPFTGLGWREGRRGRLSVAPVRPDRRDRQPSLPPLTWDIEIDGTPAQVAATILAAKPRPRAS